MTNFFVEKNVEDAIHLVERGEKAGYNGIVFNDTKLQSLETYPDFYVRSMTRFLAAARSHHMQVIPGVCPVGYADSMLAHDPSLVESMPCRNVGFFVRKGELQPMRTQDGLFFNGDFEASNGDRFPSYAFQDAPGVCTFVDKSVKHNGAQSMRIEEPSRAKETNGNVRIMQRIPVDPWRQYRLSAWVRTEGFTNASQTRMLIGDPKVHPLCFMELGIAPTQGWKQVQVVFNSQENRSICAYFGVWSGGKGKLWVDEIKIQDVPLLNITRRPSCPLTMRTEDGKPVVEGVDVEPVVDPQFGNFPWKGEFEFQHPAPRIKLTPNSRLHERDRVFMDYYAATAVMEGQTAICLSDPGTNALIKAEIANVTKLMDPDGYFLAHDEMRVIGWCGACEQRHATSGELLATNVRTCREIVRAVKPSAPIFVWNDMFDPYHNAVDDYYLANHSLKNSWLGLDRSMIVVNWNSGNAEKSLDFFAKRGHKQILAGYYDGPVNNIQAWMKSAAATGSLVGVMYTTWAGKYDDLEAFATAAWGGPR